MFVRYFSLKSSSVVIKFFQIVCLLSLLSACQSTSQTKQPQTLLIGGYTQGAGEGIYRLAFDGNTLKNQGLVAKETNPSYLAIHKNKSQVFAAIGDESGGIAQFEWDSSINKLILMDRIIGLGKGACHIALDVTGQKAAIANYGSGEIFLVGIDADNSSKSLSLIGSFKNSGHSITSRQTSPHMHFVHWDNSGQFLYAVDLGTDEVLVIETNEYMTKTVKPNNKHSQLAPKIATKLTPGDGPRHLVFHPDKPLVYVLNELSNTITSYRQNTEDGTLSLLHRIDALQAETTLNNKASAIKISNDGKFIYAAIRGINQISVFEIKSNGTLAFIQSHSTMGEWPRDITLSAEQDYLFIANRHTNAINVLKRNIMTGLLSPTTISASVPTPSYIGLF